MFSTIDKKVKTIVKSLIHGSNNYENPFIYDHTIDIDGFVLLNNKSFKNISVTGLYKNHFTEIMYLNTELTSKHHEHLLNIINTWKVIPYILCIRENGEIGQLIPYENLINVKNLNFDDWIKASATKNYMIDDPMSDYIMNKKRKLASEYEHVNSDSVIEPSPFYKNLFFRGNDFEVTILEKFRDLDIDICDLTIYREPLTLYIRTIEALKDKRDLIYQGTLLDPYLKTFGKADFIIHSSVSKQIFNNYNDTFKDVYEIFDSKWSTINILNNNNLLNNNKVAKTYKAQLWIYVNALNKMCKQKSLNAYVIGRKYKYSKTDERFIEGFTKSKFNPFNELARIDYSLEKENIDKTKNAIKWLKKVKNDKVLETDVFPNMKSTDPFIQEEKTKIANENKEITLIYNVGYKHRNNAVKEGITTLDDERLTCEILGIKKESAHYENIKNILKVNKNSFQKTLIFNTIKDRYLSFEAPIRIYLDIETLNRTAFSLNHLREEYVFMIGIGIVKNGIFKYKCCHVTDLLPESEENMLNYVKDKLLKIAEKNRDEIIPIFHWSPFEQRILEPLLNLKNKSLIFYDMCKWAKDCKLAIKGAYDYKLKSFIKALNLDNNTGINNGLDAMNRAHECYVQAENEQSTQVFEEDSYQSIIEYNENDCLAMHKVHLEVEKSL